MGVGYDRNLSQWSRGEYANADNPEDDLAVIQSYGLGYRADDHGDSVAAATALPAGSALAVSGSITQAADIDVFGFTAAAGAVSFSVRPAEHGPDLDLQIAVLTADGSILAISDPPDTLGADISLTLGSAGAYYLRVQGVGKGDPLTTGYTDYASLGQYAITGTVVDPGTTPRPPVAVASATPNTGAAPLVVAFTAAGSSDLDGSIVAYAWDFGDGGSATGAAVTHTYSAAGSFTATLTVTDDSGRTGTADVTVRVVPRPPVAVASATPTSGDAPLTVAFTAAGSSDLDGSIVAYAWDFGDGTGATGAAVTHTYPAGGAYTATLTVTDNDGLTGSAAVTIRARAFNQFPAAVASATPSTGVAPLVVAFTAAGSSDLDGSIVAYTWDFGDGAGATGATVTHTYMTGGSFTVTLTVTDERGGTGRSSMIVRVTIGSRASLTAPATSAYASATLSGSLRTASGALLAGRPMVIQSSSDAAHWTTVKTIVTGAGGTFKTKVMPTRRTSYRARFSGDDVYAPSSSATRVVKPRVRLTTPDAPLNAQRGRSFTVSGYLEPRHIAGTSAVMLDCYRFRSGAWTLRKTVVAVASNYRTYTRYRASVSLQSVGSWRIRARHAADAWMPSRGTASAADCAMRRSAYAPSRPPTAGHAGLRRGGVTVRERSDHDDVCFPNPLEPYAPLIINVALTGVIPSKAMTPHVLTPAEIVADAVRCHDVGAAVVHVHARDRDGRPTYDAEVFAEIISGNHRERPQLIVCATTSGRRYGEFEQRSAVLELDGDARPDLASLTTGSPNFPDGPSVNTPEMIAALAERMQARGIKPEFEVLELGMVNTAKLLIEGAGAASLLLQHPPGLAAHRRGDGAEPHHCRRRSAGARHLVGDRARHVRGAHQHVGDRHGWARADRRRGQHLLRLRTHTAGTQRTARTAFDAHR